MATKRARELQAGDVVVRVPYAGPERMPLAVIAPLAARKRGCVIIHATDADGRDVLVPVGHGSNLVEVR